MKFVAFSGSPRKAGNTAIVINQICNNLENDGFNTEIYYVGNQTIHGCMACGWCKNNRCFRCVNEDDPVNSWIDKMLKADGILIASPIYFSGITGPMKCFLDRAFFVAWANGGLFRHKIGASFTVARRAGCIQGIDQLNHYLTYSEMILATGNYWNVIYGHVPGEVKQDKEGMQIIDSMVKNIKYLMRLKDQSTLPPPEPMVKVYTNFIR